MITKVSIPFERQGDRSIFWLHTTGWGKDFLALHRPLYLNCYADTSTDSKLLEIERDYEKGEKWTLTHIASGLSVVKQLESKTAMCLMNELESRYPHEIGNLHKLDCLELINFFFKLSDLLNAFDLTEPAKAAIDRARLLISQLANKEISYSYNPAKILLDHKVKKI